jgi:8-oxo-dGTP pyrophosphatase MutT (NUDIX family)
MSENPWKVKASRDVYENNWIKVTEYDVINPSGGPGIYGKVHFKNRALGILALDEDDNIYLVGQFRFVLDQYSWEIPEGGGGMDEDPLEAAKRELEEETGLVAKHWEKLMDFHLSNSVSDEFGHVYLATGLQQGHSSPEETEDITVRKLHIDQAYKMVLNGEITDSMSVAAILRAKLFIQERSIK